MQTLKYFIFLFALGAHAQTPLTSEFTYQGHLHLNGVPASGVYDLDLYLFDAATGGAQTGQFLVDDLTVDDGFFSVDIDFGDAPFSGDEVWLEVRVREGASVGAYEPLLPRQKITATPYATQAQFVAENAVGTVQIQSGAVTVDKLSDDAVNTNNLINSAVNSDKLAADAVDSSKIQDGGVNTDDLADAAITADKIANAAVGTDQLDNGAVDANILADDSVNTNHIGNGSVAEVDLATDAISSIKIQNNAVTQSKLADDAVGMDQIDPTEVQRRLIGTCAPGQYVTSVNEDGTMTCANAVVEDQSAAAICQTSAGAAGILIDGVCVLDYRNSSSHTWQNAVSQCASLGGDLCSASQYLGMRNNGSVFNEGLFYFSRPVWSNDFSDDDNGVKNFVLHSSDNPISSQNYAYACCGNVLPEPSRSRAQDINGVLTTYVHTQEDTTWSRAAKICTQLNSDLCSKAQYVALNDAGLFGGVVRRATNEMSDNDGNLFDPIVGSNTDDNPQYTQLHAFACCAQSTKPIDLSCPGTLIGGVCVGFIHEDEDTLFADAARTCHNAGANLCSKSQMQVIRDAGQFNNSNACWTADGADNDGGNVGGLLPFQVDNPNPASDLFGYACCY